VTSALESSTILLETQINPDHLRLLLSLKPDQTVSRSVNILKGNLSREFGSAFAEDLHRHNTKTLWARGYFARSSGKVDLELARNYVEAQVSHHGYKGDWTKALKFRNSAFKSPTFNLAHCLSMLDYHLVLVTEHRKALFDEAIAPGLFKYVMAMGEKSGFVIRHEAVSGGGVLVQFVKAGRAVQLFENAGIPPRGEAVKKLKSIADTTQETEIRRLGRAVYPHSR
jgi:REP element-mobilizing transposase RayT